VDSKREGTIAHSEGFLEDFIEGEQEAMKEKNPEYATQVQNMWQVLSTGLREYRRENAELIRILANVRIAVGGTKL
jgi:hypothetical protein